MSCCSPKKQNDASSHSSSSCCKKEQVEREAANKGGCCSPREEKSGDCCSKPKRETIDRHMTIEEILGMFPYKAQRLSQEITNAGLHCVGCHAAVWETLEGGMYGHGKSDEEIDHLVNRLNALLQEKVDLNSITLTPRAAGKFLEILEEEQKTGWGLRFSEELAGCSGFEYVLDFSEKADSDDKVFHSQGIEIHVKQAVLPRLLGSEIDYVEGLRGSGFKISNPNVSTSCGCGSSHNYS